MVEPALRRPGPGLALPSKSAHKIIPKLIVANLLPHATILLWLGHRERLGPQGSEPPGQQEGRGVNPSARGSRVASVAQSGSHRRCVMDNESASTIAVGPTCPLLDLDAHGNVVCFGWVSPVYYFPSEGIDDL